MRRSSSVVTAINPQRTALLIDLENLLHAGDGLYVSAVDADRRLRRVLGYAEHATFVLAAASSGVLARYITDSAVLGTLPLRAVSADPDAADEYLLSQAEHLAAVGYGHFVIASGDHAFTAFAATHSVDVVTGNAQCLAKSLASAAATTRIAA